MSSNKKRKASSSSISDLAPFVASVLRDEVVSDLKEELDNYKKNFNKVEITGPKGDPVFARGDLARGSDASNPRLWRVRLKITRLAKLNELQDIQVQIGGITLISFKTSLCTQFCFEYPDFETTTDSETKDSDNQEAQSCQLFSWVLAGNSIVFLECVFGPVTREQYEQLNNTNRDDVLTVLQDQDLTRIFGFGEVAIDKSDIYDRLGMLEKQNGIDTNRDCDLEKWKNRRKQRDEDNNNNDSS